MNDFKETATKLREIADIAENISDLLDREKNGEDVTVEFEAAMGRFIIKYMGMSKL